MPMVGTAPSCTPTCPTPQQVRSCSAALGEPLLLQAPQPQGATSVRIAVVFKQESDVSIVMRQV